MTDPDTAPTPSSTTAPRPRSAEDAQHRAHLPPEVSRYRRPVLFYVLATAVPWVLWLIAGYLSRRAQTSSLTEVAVTVLAIAGLLAPVAVAIALVMPDPVLRKDAIRRLTSLRGTPGWVWPLALLLLPGALLLATVISLPLGYSPDQFHLRDVASFSTGVIPPLVTLIGAALFEELAWHSYGTDALASRWSVWRTSLVFAVIWVIWHMPLASIEGFYQDEVVQTGWLSSVNFIVSIFPFVILMNWLYYRGGRSILVAIGFHAAANVGNELFFTDPDTKAIQTAVLVAVAALVVWRERALFFSKPTRPGSPTSDAYRSTSSVRVGTTPVR